MKALISSILKCNSCESNLKINIKTYHRVEPSKSEYLLDNIEFYKNDDNLLLNDFVKEINKFEKIEIDVNDNKEIRDFLDSVVIEEGELVCISCDAKYPITEEIVDFYNKK